MPVAVDSSNWVIYFAKPSSTVGSFYTETHNITNYKPDSYEDDLKTMVYFNDYYTSDLNNDGKTGRDSNLPP